MEVEFKYLSHEVDGKIARIALNRPRLLNAMHKAAVSELDRVTDLIDRDDNIRIVTLTGVGRAFSSGIDLKLSLIHI